MTTSILYCFRNRVRHLEDHIKVNAEEAGKEIAINPTYCMKLCIFCEKMHVAVVNQKPVMVKQEIDFMSKIMESLD